jgi:glycosyltransferase involved in cell wall biosynthesis
MDKPLVSIVVTTKNEEKNIGNCLRSIKIQSYTNIEIIVVDNFSVDKTKNLAKKYTKNVFDKGPERSAQRNFGMIDKAKGKYVIFIDADMILSPSLILACVSFMEKNKSIALHIPEIVLGASFSSKVRRFERKFYDGTVIDGARFFLRQSFIKVGGFDESLSGPEDWDIDKKIKKIGKIALLNSPESIVSWEMEEFIKSRGSPVQKYCCVYHNESEFNLAKYLAKKSYYSSSFEVYKNKWNNDADIKKQLGLSYRFFGVFIEDGKWFNLLKHPFLTGGMYYLRFRVGIAFLKRRKPRKEEVHKK